jgi:hypothetical protein
MNWLYQPVYWIYYMNWLYQPVYLVYYMNWLYQPVYSVFYILKGIDQPCFRTVLHGFLIDKLLKVKWSVLIKMNWMYTITMYTVCKQSLRYIIWTDSTVYYMNWLYGILYELTLRYIIWTDSTNQYIEYIIWTDSTNQSIGYIMVLHGFLIDKLLKVKWAVLIKMNCMYTITMYTVCKQFWIYVKKYDWM